MARGTGGTIVAQIKGKTWRPDLDDSEIVQQHGRRYRRQHRRRSERGGVEFGAGCFFVLPFGLMFCFVLTTSLASAGVDEGIRAIRIASSFLISLSLFRFC
jgi:hypothetical protein